MSKVFTVDKVSWHTQVKRNYEFNKDLLYSCFKNIINYLQKNNLTTHTILKEGENVTEHTCIMSTDLTEEGFQLIKKKYDKWTEGIMDKGKSPSDFTILDKELKKIKGK
jgi:hypothetical protein